MSKSSMNQSTKRPTKGMYLQAYGAPSSYKIEVCACKYNSKGEIVDFATEVFEGRNLKAVPLCTPLQLNIMDRNDEKVEDVLFHLDSTGAIIFGYDFN